MTDKPLRSEQHPLTDEMCKKIQLHIFNQNDEDCMRAAADWQLEEFKKRVRRGLKAYRQGGYSAAADAVEDFFEQIVMEIRPQQQQEES